MKLKLQNTQQQGPGVDQVGRKSRSRVCVPKVGASMIDSIDLHRHLLL